MPRAGRAVPRGHHHCPRCSGLPPAGLTYAEREVEQAHADVEAEEEDGVCHFAEHEDVPDVLLHGDCGRERGTEDGARSPQKTRGNPEGGPDLVLRIPAPSAPWGRPHKHPPLPCPSTAANSLERRFFIITMALRNMRISTSRWDRRDSVSRGTHGTLQPPSAAGLQSLGVATSAGCSRTARPPAVRLLLARPGTGTGARARPCWPRVPASSLPPPGAPLPPES